MDIREVLNEKVNGATFLSIDTSTIPTLTGGKKNPMQGRITKVMVGSNVMVFQNKNTNAYENMVHRRLAQEGKDPASFELGERAWGVREHGTPFVTHKGELYLEVIFLKAGEVSYYLDGQPIDKNQIIGLSEKEEGRQGGLENKVIIRTFKAVNVQAINVGHQRYERFPNMEFALVAQEAA